MSHFFVVPTTGCTFFRLKYRLWEEKGGVLIAFTYSIVMRRLVPSGRSNFFGWVLKCRWMLDTSSKSLGCVFRGFFGGNFALELFLAERCNCELHFANTFGIFFCFWFPCAISNPFRRLFTTAWRLSDASAKLARARYRTHGWVHMMAKKTIERPFWKKRELRPFFSHLYGVLDVFARVLQLCDANVLTFCVESKRL